MAEVNGNGAPPVANRSVVQGELRRALVNRHRNPRSFVLLLRAAAEWRGDGDFDAEIAGGKLPVRVVPCPTVLAVLDALAARRDSDRYLVLLTPREPHEVGDSVLARAMLAEIKPINRWDLLREAFGARALDENLAKRANGWAAEALLDAQPAGGWRRLAGPVLSLDTALNRLATTRLGIDAADDSPVDGAALLQWTADSAAVASFMQLREAERDGLIGWLAQTTGGVAEVVFAMAESTKIPDAIPVGLAIAALHDQPEHIQPGGQTLISRVRAEERYFSGSQIRPAALRAFWEAAESLVTRWAANGHALQAAACCERAEVILVELGTPEVARDSRVLQAGLDARFAALAATLRGFLADPASDALAQAVEALRRIREHGRQRDRAAEVSVAEAAVRVMGWLTHPEAEPTTLADAATRVLRSWAWADRAMAILSSADTSRVPELAEAYEALLRPAKTRRERLDARFAELLAVGTARPAGSDDPLPVEDVLDRIARPVAGERSPVVVVLDGMSPEMATELAEQLAVGGLWLEAGRLPDGREAALAIAAVAGPSLATAGPAAANPRASLLTGALSVGSEVEERAGFIAFWGRRSAVLLYEDDVTPSLDHPIADEVRDAILDQNTVIGVVLSAGATVVDEGARARVSGAVDGVHYLRPVLDEARRASRPVILAAVADGASPAEAVIPVITLLPADTLLPPGWYTYDAVGHAPAWWEAASSRPRSTPLEQLPSTQPRPGASRRKRPAIPTADDPGALFGLREVMSADGTVAAADDSAAAEPPPPTAVAPGSGTVTRSLGERVVGSSRLTGQREYLRRAPDDVSVAALIDGITRAGGQLTLAEAAALVGEHPVRMSGYLTQVGRLLNLDGYAVLQVIDAGKTVKLDQRLLRQQFLGG